MESITKSLIKNSIAYILFKSNIWKKLHKAHLIVLGYHRILPQSNKSTIQPGMYVNTKTFEKHIYFLSNNYKIISFNDYINKSLNPSNRYCIITFDDGWLDNYLYAYPILKKYNVPAIIFLTCEYVNTNKLFWTERLARILDYAKKTNFLLPKGTLNKLFIAFYNARSLKEKRELFHKIIDYLKALPHDKLLTFIERLENSLKIGENNERCFLNWDEIKDMSCNNIYFGSHGMSHNSLIKLSTSHCKKEIETSMHLLKSKGINFLPIFSYPYGDYNATIKQLLKQHGYWASITMEPGLNKLYNQDLFTIKRFNIHEDISKNYPLLCFHILGMK